MPGPDTLVKHPKTKETIVRVALYGGSFNPPHKVHGLVAEWVVESGLADAVWLVPVFAHAFEGQHDKALAAFEDRVRWCRALAHDLSVTVVVSTVEEELPVPSYSVDTLDYLASNHPEHSFRLVVGADILDSVSGWKDWERIQQVYDPIVVGRAGYESPEESRVFADVSSTAVRDRVKRGLTVDEWVTPSVAALLQQGNPWQG